MNDFSIIILCYNSEWNALKRTIDSVLCQKGISFEIILADDASSNDCLQKAKDYLKAKEFSSYRALAHEQNVGTVQNISDALEESTGKYVKCIGAGDLLFDHHTLKKVIAHMEKLNCAMCFGKMLAYHLEKEEPIFTPFYVPADIAAYQKNNLSRIQKNIIQNHGWIAGASMFYRTEVFQRYLPELLGTVRYCEDLLQVNLLLHDEQISYYPHAVMFYEVGSGISTNSSAGNNSRMKKDHDQYWDMMCKQYPKNKLVQKGRKTHILEYISNTKKRMLLFLFHSPSYLLMHLKTKLQKKYYAINEKCMFLK